jgi:hypothetical protein
MTSPTTTTATGAERLPSERFGAFGVGLGFALALPLPAALWAGLVDAAPSTDGALMLLGALVGLLALQGRRR